jgi:diguanylate cyclase (GGDEF)-like protein/PAS domain S-box-containing protein
METLAQHGLLFSMAASGCEFFAPFAYRLHLGHPISIPWTVFVFVLCLSAAAGALVLRHRLKAELRRRDEEPAVRELAMLRTLFANLPDTLYVKDTESRFLMANQGAVENMGATSSAELMGKTDFDFFPEALAAGFFEDERKVLSGKPQISKEEYITEPDGRIRYLSTTKVPLFDTAGKVIGMAGVGRNITAMKEVEAELRRTREELQFKATHDSLTNLLNRGAILEMLVRELARGVRENGRTAVLLGDLDHFKNINDTHGHPIGDEVLREVTSRLLKTVRSYDLVGRYGGEEFLVVLCGCAATDAMARADHLRKAIAASPMPTAHGPLPMTISFGVLVAQQWGNPTSDEVLREVDAALYEAKAAGRNRCSLAVPAANPGTVN